MLARFGGEMATSFVTASFPLPALSPLLRRERETVYAAPCASGYNGAR
jgi:hypothetical protein